MHKMSLNRGVSASFESDPWSFALTGSLLVCAVSGGFAAWLLAHPGLSPEAVVAAMMFFVGVAASAATGVTCVRQRRKPNSRVRFLGRVSSLA